MGERWGREVVLGDGLAGGGRASGRGVCTGSETCRVEISLPEGGREAGREGERQGEREGEREGERQGEREGGRESVL